MMSLTLDFPRASLAHLPTPLESMPRLAAELGMQAPFLIKRDDCTGLATGGNKVRQLEYYLGDALAKGATRILITGAVQSNYVRTAAAAAAKLGLACSVQLEERVKDMGRLYAESGNVLLDRMLGADIHHFPEGEDEAGADASLEALAAKARSAGEVPYVIHLSETPIPLGALGYVACAQELLTQSTDTIGTVVVASGSGVTHAGLLVGLRACGRSDIKVLGACVRRDAVAQHARILRVSRQVEKLLGKEGLIVDDDVEVTDAVLGAGYGKVHFSTREALMMAATFEGLIMDPVYSAKTLAAAIAFVRTERPVDAVVVIHTGGLPAVFAYGDRVFEEDA